jgi:hypothetical protein
MFIGSLNFDSLEGGQFTRVSMKFGSVSERDYIFNEVGLSIQHSIVITHPLLTYSNCAVYDSLTGSLTDVFSGITVTTTTVTLALQKTISNLEKYLFELVCTVGVVPAAAVTTISIALQEGATTLQQGVSQNY